MKSTLTDILEQTKKPDKTINMGEIDANCMSEKDTVSLNKIFTKTIKDLFKATDESGSK